MTIAVSPDEILAVLQRDFPLQHEIAVLRVVTDAQARRIAELEQAQADTAVVDR